MGVFARTKWLDCRLPVERPQRTVCGASSMGRFRHRCFSNRFLTGAARRNCQLCEVRLISLCLFQAL